MTVRSFPDLGVHTLKTNKPAAEAQDGELALHSLAPPGLQPRRGSEVLNCGPVCGGSPGPGLLSFHSSEAGSCLEGRISVSWFCLGGLGVSALPCAVVPIFSPVPT